MRKTVHNTGIESVYPRLRHTREFVQVAQSAMIANLSRRRRGLRRQAVVLAAMLAMAHGPALSASFTVNTTIDERDSNAGDGICNTSSGACSLRAAIEETNALPGPDSITLPSGTYRITLGNGDDNGERGDFDVLDILTISGAGQSATFVDGNDVDRVFDVDENASLDLSGVTVRNGDENQGGGIRNEGVLSLTNVIVRDNTGKDGGGVAVRKNGANAEFTNVTFLNNVADKGAGLHVKDDTNVTITDSTFRNNTADKDGGGAYLDKPIARITGSVFDGNSAEKGGGMFIKGNAADVALINVTVSGNSGSKEGGGIHKESNGSARLTNVTVAGNSSPRGAGLRGKDGLLSLLNTIVADNLQHDDCDGAITSLGYNLDNDDSCQLNQAGDLPSTDPQLGSLQDNGGPTWTHSLADFSPARDAATNAGCPAGDQRGFPRPVDGNADGLPVCDIGAFEADQLYPDYSLEKDVATLSDPYSGSTNPKAIPGATMQYTMRLGNAGPGLADQGSIVITDAVPADSSLIVTDFDASNPGPVAFVDGTPPSGLSYSFVSLDSSVDDIEFSADGGVTWVYTPVPGADGSDPLVTHFRITPTGSAAFTGSYPVAEFLMKVVVH